MEFIVRKTEKEITNKQREAYDKWCELIQWGRRSPVHFCEYIFGIEFLDQQKIMFMNSWDKAYVLWCCSRNGGKSFLVAPFGMCKQILVPSYQTYILAGTHEQSINTMKKIEDISKKAITSLKSLTDVFDYELSRNQSNLSGISHLPSGWRYSLYNNSSCRSLSSDYDKNRGYRSNLNIYDECGFLDERLIINTTPFLAQDNDFELGKNHNVEIVPSKFPNTALLCSSASDMDTYFYKQYKEWSKQMIMGNPNYYVADINADIVLHPFYNGKRYPKALLTQETIDDAMRQNKSKAMREYYNIFDANSGDTQPIKRSIIMNNSEFRIPELCNMSNDKNIKYGLFYDPARKVDNSICLICKFIRKEDVGWTMQMVNCISFADMFKKSKTPCQVQTQLAEIKELIVKYNGDGFAEYENLVVMIDGGSGGGGQFYADFLCEDFTTKDGKKHRGLIDAKSMDEYVRKFPNAYDCLRVIDPNKFKVTMYNELLSMLKSNLISFTESYDDKGFLTIVKTVDGLKDDDVNKQVAKTYELSFEEEMALKQIDLLKEELISMCRYENVNRSYRWDIIDTKKWTTSGYDDRGYCAALAGYYLSELRHADKMNQKIEEVIPVTSCATEISFD